MSLSIDGTWKAGVWDPTVWAGRRMARRRYAVPDAGIGLVAEVGIGLSRPPVDFVFHTGDVAMRFVDYRKIREVKAPVVKLPPKPVYKEDSELQEMLGLYAGWRKAA
jgi:hypothetical protein